MSHPTKILFGVAIASVMLGDLGSRAQTLDVVPSPAADQEQPSAISLPGLGFSGRMQIIVDASQLVSLTGRHLTGIEFRRDTSRPFDHESGTASVTVRLGTASTAPLGAHADFSANSIGASVVYQGTVTSDASSVGSYAGWVSPHVIRIDFSPSYTYSGGHLLVDIEGNSTAHVWWPVDAAVDSASGSTLVLGSDCGPLSASHLAHTISVSEQQLLVGSTVVVTSFVPALSAGMLLFGLTTLSVPFDLGAIGAPGCSLIVDPIALLQPRMIGASQAAETIAEFHLGLPADVGLLGASFVLQGISVGASGLSTSEAVGCQVAPTLPSLGCASVTAEGNGAPTVSLHLVPVLGILHD